MRRYASLRGRREFALVQRRGRVASGKHLVVFTFQPNHAKRGTRSARVGIVITKKVGTAVERNRLRRRCKAILDSSSFPATTLWCVVQIRPTAAGLEFAQLREQLSGALAASMRAATEIRPQRTGRLA